MGHLNLDLIVNNNNEKVPKNGNNNIEEKSYGLLRRVVILLIKFGSPLNLWINDNDRYLISFEKHRKFCVLFRIYCWLFMHLVFILNVHLLIKPLIKAKESNKGNDDT